MWQGHRVRIACLRLGEVHLVEAHEFVGLDHFEPFHFCHIGKCFEVTFDLGLRIERVH